MKLFSFLRLLVSLLLHLRYNSYLYERDERPNRQQSTHSMIGLLFSLMTFLFLRRRRVHQYGSYFTKRLEGMGPTYIKLGQILALRNDILPQSITEELKKLHSSTSYIIPFSVIRNIIETELKAPIDKYFSYIDETPMASGSIAQVHHASLKNKSQFIAVKVQKPNIEIIIQKELNTLSRVVFLLSKLKVLRRYHLPKIINDFTHYIMRELDFRLESQHIQKIQNNFQTNKQIVLPKVYNALTTRKILVMQYLKGKQITNRYALKDVGINVTKMAQVGAKAIMQMLFVDGLFHADPHPGNILLIGQSKIGFLDFGMVGKLTDKTRQNLFLYFFFMVSGKYEHALHYLLAIVNIDESTDIENFKKGFLIECLKWNTASHFEEAYLSQLILQIVHIATRHGISFPSDIIMAIKALITVQGVSEILDPSMKFTKFVQVYLYNMLQEQWDIDIFQKQIKGLIPELVLLMKTLPDALIQTIQTISSGQIPIYITNQIKQPAKLPAQNKSPLIMGSCLMFSSSILFASPHITSLIEKWILSWQNVPIIPGILLASSLILFLKYLLSSKNQS